jgi:hypothetical protein
MEANIGVIMSSRALLASAIAAGVVGAGLIIGLTSTATQTSVSRNAPTCDVRTSAAAAPTDKATPFGGSGSMTMNTPAPPSPVCGS